MCAHLSNHQRISSARVRLDPVLFDMLRILRKSAIQRGSFSSKFFPCGLKVSVRTCMMGFPLVDAAAHAGGRSDGNVGNPAVGSRFDFSLFDDGVVLLFWVVKYDVKGLLAGILLLVLFALGMSHVWYRSEGAVYVEDGRRDVYLWSVLH